MNRALTLVLALAGAGAAGAAALPDRAEAARVVGDYLARHGDFCLGKTDWPVDISALDARARGRDVLQMPVLESLGLVHASDAVALRVEGPETQEGGQQVPVAVRRYELTPLGEGAMREVEVPMARSEGDVRVRRRDLCAAHLALADVVAVAPGDGPRGFVATFTYVAQPAAWATSAEFQRVFPMAARVLAGARSAQLKQAFAWTEGAWHPAGLAN